MDLGVKTYVETAEHIQWNIRSLRTRRSAETGSCWRCSWYWRSRWSWRQRHARQQIQILWWPATGTAPADVRHCHMITCRSLWNSRKLHSPTRSSDNLPIDACIRLNFFFSCTRIRYVYETWYEIVYLRALKSWRKGQLNRAHGTKNARAQQVLKMPIYAQKASRYYTVFQKKGDTKLMAVTLSFPNRFSKFFHWHTQR